MTFRFEDRQSDSSFVKTIWRAQSEDAGSLISIAATHWEMVVTRYGRKTTFTVRGPETKATPLHYQRTGVEWLGIRFKLGTFLPHLPPGHLLDRREAIRGTLSEESPQELSERRIGGGDYRWGNSATQHFDNAGERFGDELRGEEHSMKNESHLEDVDLRCFALVSQ